MNNNKIEQVVINAIKSLSEISDANMIVGEPIATVKGATIIPVSKISCCFMSGGGEYGEVKFFSGTDLPHSVASGGVLSLKPSGFIVEQNKEIKFISCPNDAVEKTIDLCGDIIRSVNEKA